jgi:nitrite reductase (NO-forming)
MSAEGNDMTEFTRRKLVTTALVAGPGVFLGLNAVASQQTSTTPTASPGASPQASPGASPVAGGGAITLNAIDINWEQKELSIPASTDTTITVVNKGVLQHDFVIDALQVKSDLLNGGDSADVTINAPAGTYEYYCSVPGHKEAGMVGTLTVQ